MLKLCCFLVSLLLAGCSSIPTPEVRLQQADALAAVRQWQRISLQAGILTLAAYVPDVVVPSDTLTIYIEGDGLAWISSDTPSSDPTPHDPIGLKLALAQPSGAAAYLGRPCQYLNSNQINNCSNAYWTQKRFAPEVISATSAAADALKVRFGARHVQLVGYSGGGAVAAMVAAQRKDVTLLVTVAGNLDIKAWTDEYHLTPLTGSLNAADFSIPLSNVKQVHLVGELDQVVPRFVSESYASRFPSQNRPNPRILSGFDHTCCWEKYWQQFWREVEH